MSDAIPVSEVGNIIGFKDIYLIGKAQRREVIMSITAPRCKLLLFKGGNETKQCLAIRSFMGVHNPKADISITDFAQDIRRRLEDD